MKKLLFQVLVYSKRSELFKHACLFKGTKTQYIVYLVPLVLSSLQFFNITSINIHEKKNRTREASLDNRKVRIIKVQIIEV